MFVSRYSWSTKNANWIKHYQSFGKKMLHSLKELKQNNQELRQKLAVTQQMQAQLQQMEKQYQHLFDNAVVGIFQITPGGIYFNVNPALVNMYAYESAQQLCQDLSDSSPQLYVEPQQRQFFTKLLDNQEYISDFESQVYRRDGSTIWISENVKAVKDTQGQLLYYEGFVTDITEQKITKSFLQQSLEHIETQTTHLEQLQNQLLQQEKMSNLGELTVGVAHEIKNPLNFVRGNISPAKYYTEQIIQLIELYNHYYPEPVQEIQEQLETVHWDFLKQDLLKILSSMQFGTERIHEIIQALQNFSRLEQAQMKPVDLHCGLDSTLLILQPRLHSSEKYSGVEVIKEYGNMPFVKCFGGLLNQVFMNLLTNAIDALEETNKLPKKQSETFNLQPSTSVEIYPTIPVVTQLPKPTIRIRTEVENGNLAVIHIIDNGSGMSEQIRANIFNPFFTTKPIGKGTGLGLALSYQIVVEKHGGQLECISSEDRGTEFLVKIPMRE